MANNKSPHQKTAPSKRIADLRNQLFQSTAVVGVAVNSQVLATLLYHDMFGFPLTLKEIKKYLIGQKPLSLLQIRSQLQQKNISQRNKYYFLEGKEYVVQKRLLKEGISQRKIRKAQKIAAFLQKIPTIMFIGISGSLSMYNACETDDIDLFIITKVGTLWISRLFANMLLLISGNLRRFGRSHVKDTICTNMWIDQAHMSFAKNRQNIYAAHEIAQILPLFDRGNIYKKFIVANPWIQKFLPNVPIHRMRQDFTKSSLVLRPVESLAKYVQLMYMKRHRTSETITSGFVAFHPKDYTQDILAAWRKQLKKYEI